MATSSLSRDFVISDPKSIDKLIWAMENPTIFHLEEDTRTEEEKKEDTEKLLCKIRERLALHK